MPLGGAGHSDFWEEVQPVGNQVAGALFQGEGQTDWMAKGEVVFGIILQLTPATEKFELLTWTIHRLRNNTQNLHSYKRLVITFIYCIEQLHSAAS